VRVGAGVGCERELVGGDTGAGVVDDLFGKVDFLRWWRWAYLIWCNGDRFRSARADAHWGIPPSAAIDRGCVNTQNYLVFGCRPTLPEPLPSQYSAIRRVEFLEQGSQPAFSHSLDPSWSIWELVCYERSRVGNAQTVLRDAITPELVDQAWRERMRGRGR